MAMRKEAQTALKALWPMGANWMYAPAYQREYIYAAKDRDEVIRSVKKGFPYQCDVLGQNRRRTL